MNSVNAGEKRAKVNVSDIISRVLNMLKIDHSLASLKDALALLGEVVIEERDERVKKLLAEVNYLIAVEYKKMNKRPEMLKHARKSINLYKTINTSTLENSIPILNPILPHVLPDHMHEHVVESIFFKED